MPCTQHPKKGTYMPAFLGYRYARDEEDDLLDFAKEELCGLLHHKNQAPYLSEDLQLLADPEYEPPTPSPRRRKRKKATTKKRPKPIVFAASPVPQAGEEEPAPVSSPFLRRQSQVPSTTVSPMILSPVNHSTNIQDCASFW